MKIIIRILILLFFIFLSFIPLGILGGWEIPYEQGLLTKEKEDERTLKRLELEEQRATLRNLPNILKKPEKLAKSYNELLKTEGWFGANILRGVKASFNVLKERGQLLPFLWRFSYMPPLPGIEERSAKNELNVFDWLWIFANTDIFIRPRNIWQYIGYAFTITLRLFGEFMIIYLILTAIIVIREKKKIFWHWKRVFYAFLITFFINAFLTNIAAYRQPEILKFEALLYFGRMDSSTMAAAVYRRIVGELIMPAGILGIILLGVYVFSRMGPKYRKELINKQLIKASEKGDIKKVTLLLENGADVNTKDNDGWTPLMHAAEKGHKEVVELLIEKGADVNTKDNDGWTPLMYASKNNDLEIIRLLLEKGANVNLTDKYGQTALILASANGHKEVVELLLEKGANVNIQDEDGWTALMFASQNGYKEVVELMIENGADVNAKDNLGKTALMLASENGHKEIVELLKSYGAKR
jgi:hypothetical protein